MAMWRSIKMPTGRWLVVRYRPGRDTGAREFYKKGPASVWFDSEDLASAMAETLNASS